MNELIHQIYATALDANQWPQLLVSLAQYLQISENSSADRLKQQQFIQSHFSQAIEINNKQNVSEDKKNLAETSLSLLPIALFSLSSTNSNQVINPLNHKAESLLPKLTEKLNTFFLQSLANHNGNSQQMHSQYIIQDEETYLFLELPIEPLSIKESNRVVLVNTNSQFLFNSSRLFSHWDLSSKEEAICKQLLEGESIKSIALKNSRSIHTIRSQVKSIFQKSGLHSQIDLIRYFYTSPMSISSEDQKSKNHPISTLESFKMKLSDGRTLSWAEHGDKNGIPVVLCHSMHQSRLMRHPNEIFAKKMNIRIITPDRPGYGNSDKNEQLEIKNWPKDLYELLKHLNVKRFSLLGIGLGTMFAFSAAQAFGKRVLTTVCINIPNYVQPIPNCDYPNMLRKTACKLAKHTPKLLLKIMKLAGRDIFLKDPISILTKFYPCTSINDQKILQSEFLQQMLIKDFSESNKQGFGQALIRELNFFLNHKRIFEPKKIQTPVICWYKNNCENPNQKEIEQFIDEMPNAKSYIIESDDDFIIYHQWKNYLYQTAYGKPFKELT